MKLKIQSAGRRGTLTNAMYTGYRTEVKQTNHIIIGSETCWYSHSALALIAVLKLVYIAYIQLPPSALPTTGRTELREVSDDDPQPCFSEKGKNAHSFWCVAVKIFTFLSSYCQDFGEYIWKKSKNLHVLRADGWGRRYHHQPLWLGVQACIQLQAGAILPKQQQDKGDK